MAAIAPDATALARTGDPGDRGRGTEGDCDSTMAYLSRALTTVDDLSRSKFFTVSA